jgi:hypothetical protein
MPRNKAEVLLLGAFLVKVFLRLFTRRDLLEDE